MIELDVSVSFKLGNNPLSQNLAELYAPLIERINVPNNALGENGMLVKGNELTQVFWRELLGNNRVRWAVAFEDPMRHEPIRSAFRLHFLRRLTERKGLGLR